MGRGGSLGTMLAAAGLSSACALDPIILDVPFEPTDRAAIVVVEEGARLDVFAIDAALRDTTPVLRSIAGFQGEPELHVSAFFYADPLADLGLAAGRVPSPSDGSASQGLPAYVRARETVVAFEGARAWTDVRALDASIAMLRLPARDPCETFELRAFDVDAAPGLAGVAPIDASSALVATYDPSDGTAGGRYFRLTLTGLEPVDLRLPGLRPFDVVEQDGRIFLGGESRADGSSLFVAGTVDGGFELLPRRPSFGWDVLAMAAPPEGSGDDAELYLLTTFGQLQALKGGAWIELGRAPDAGYSPEGALAWVAPGELVFAVAEPPGIWRIDGTTVTAEPLTPPPGGLEELGTVVSLAVVPGFGPLAGSKGGYLLERHDRGWDVLSTPALVSNAIFALTPFHGGVLTAESRGLVRQLYPERGECTDANVFLGQEVRLDRAVPVAGGVVTAGLEVFGPAVGQRRLVAGALTRR